MNKEASPERAQSLKEMEEGSNAHIPGVQRSWREHPDGYSRFAAFLVDDPDKTGTIFRRFDRTSARSLLYLENELDSLETRLDRLEDECDLDTLTRAYLRDWDALSGAADGGDNRATQIRILVLDIRKKVEEYRKTVHRCSSLTIISDR